ncbi:unnamed protein product [Rotaria sordida]|uniref:Uncharacterized protein n=1 Tax=Rotaria sordida TaxID=392033 RepID=A0A815ENE5_9BILA|nr:unnamed protein product [Rotaria sordida]CAF1105759.1 unnamed protein product [Rotaria sordida]CAF1312331.1 unnamed protein product [Rotaria sordida]CAF1313118.1 unnamed protein product [Rotaria sordida]
MLLTSRDAQRERRSLYALAAAAEDDRLSFTGTENPSFQPDSVSNSHASNILSRPQSQSQIQPQQFLMITDIATDEAMINNAKESISSSRDRRYHWRMSYYFYIHICWFIITALLGGLIVWLIENHSSARNLQMKVDYIDAWFVSSSCVSSCGLTTIDFAKLSVASQVILMIFTFISGVTVSTLPALFVKAQTHRRIEGITVDDDHGELDNENHDELPTINIRRKRNLPEHIRNRLATLPTAQQLRYRAYLTCIVLIAGTCFTIYLIIFSAIGSWLSTHYTPEQLLQGNVSVNPWYISFIITVTGFNQNGLAPFSDGLSRFVGDIYINFFVMILVISGTSLFPFLLRNVILLVRLLSPWRHKVIFDYILLNNHRLCTLLFPAAQTRIYLLVTFILHISGVSISLILDLNSEHFTMYQPGIRFIIFMFHTVNTRFAGFQTVDINSFATATLVVYLLLMATKPQMLCALEESPFELVWLALQAREAADAETNSLRNINTTSGLPVRSSRSGSAVSLSTSSGLPIRSMERFLRRQSFVTKNLARQQFNTSILENDTDYRPRRLKCLYIRYFLIYFIRALIKHTISFFILTRTWLFFFIFLICAIENSRMSPIDPNITIFKIIFEIISAFGTVGLTLGYPNISSSFSTVLSSASKVILVITMLMGRHRGLLASMTDQEAIEHSAADLLDRKCEEVIYEYQKTILDYNEIHRNTFEEEITQF